MLKYVFRRIFATIPVLIGVSIIVFFMVRLIPGDPVLILSGMEVSEEQLSKIRHELGLDRPIYIQYLIYAKRAVKGDMGRSIHSRRPVWNEIKERFPATFELTTTSILIAAFWGIIIGVISAVKQYSLFDHLSMVSALASISMPIFLLGLLLMWFFSLILTWFPTGGRPDCFWCIEKLKYLILPALTLSGASLPMIARLTRSTMLEVIRQDYITTARAKGLAERCVIFKHALRNALIPVVTYMGLQYAILLGGAVVTEQIFSWPGMGRLVVEAIQSRDYPVIQGCILFLAVVSVMMNLFVDLIYGFLDPKIRYE
jgi:ABC-type dipeptide/oligopeptide/nickel transport system permease component